MTRPWPNASGSTPDRENHGPPVPAWPGGEGDETEPPTVEIKQVEELIAIGGKFYQIDGESWCDTPLHSWKLVPGVGFVRQD